MEELARVNRSTMEDRVLTGCEEKNMSLLESMAPQTMAATYPR